MWKRHPILTIIATISIGFLFLILLLIVVAVVSPGPAGMLREGHLWFTTCDAEHEAIDVVRSRLQGSPVTRTEWRRLAVKLIRRDFPDGFVSWDLGLSLLWMIVGFGVPPLIWIALMERSARWVKENRCGQCGYDLRGSGAECPECGATRPAQIPGSD